MARVTRGPNGIFRSEAPWVALVKRSPLFGFRQLCPLTVSEIFEWSCHIGLYNVKLFGFKAIFRIFCLILLSWSHQSHLDL